MMASQATKVHDPMYNFDTHFPERLSRLHLHGDAPGSIRKKKSRTQRNAARYKTQPVTFDEIKEVDEEPVAEERPKSESLMGQFQAFSRSMDGLLPRTLMHDQTHHPHHHSHSRSGSRKFQRHPDCIPERDAETEQQKPEVIVALERLPSGQSAEAVASSQSQSKVNASEALDVPSATSGSGSRDSSPSVTPANMASRRQKVTAKAKKRQKANEDGDMKKET